MKVLLSAIAGNDEERKATVAIEQRILPACLSNLWFIKDVFWVTATNLGRIITRNFRTVT
jgi:hypothetical protein